MSLEIPRKIVHLITGIIFIIIIFYLKKVYSIIFFSSILILGIIVSIISKKFKVPIIDHFLEFFDRESDKLIMPGKGLIMFVTGTLASLLFFEKTFVILGVFVLALGDPIASITGKLIGKLKTPWNKSKHFDGSILAIIICGTIISLFMNNYLFFIPVAVAMLVETIPLRKLGLDDNFLIPIIVAAIATLI